MKFDSMIHVDSQASPTSDWNALTTDHDLYQGDVIGIYVSVCIYVI